MDCLQVTETGELEVTDVPVPAVGAGEVLVEVEATGVGRTVYNNIRGPLADESDWPLIPGHEFAGRVSEVGPGVDRVEPGDPVTAHYYLFCGDSEPCEAGHEPLCENLWGNLGVDADGAYAEYVRLPARNLVGLPDGLDPVAATTIPDAVATPYHVANQRARVEPGDDVLVLGAGGGVGIHLVQVIQHFGGRATAVDRRDAKLERCRELGAVETVDTRTESVADLRGSYDAVVDFTASMELAAEATAVIAPQGRFVHLTPFADRTVELTPKELVWKEFDVVGSRYCSKYEIRRSATLVAEGAVEPVVTDVVDLAGVEGLFERIVADDHLGRGAVAP